MEKTKISLPLMICRWFTKNIGTKSFVKRIAIIALPIYLTSILTIAVNIIDSSMIAPLGADKLASINAANEVVFFAVASSMGFLQMGFIYFAQFHGKNKTSYQVKSSLTVTVYCSFLWTAFLVIIIQFTSEHLISIFLSDSENIKTGSEYLRIVSYSWLFNAITISIVWALARIGKPILAIGTSATSLVAKVILNYLFINGIWVPRMEVIGVALSTILARVIELGVAATTVIIFQIKEFKGFLLPKYWSIEIFKKIATKWIILFNEMFWVTSLIFQFWLTTRRGDAAAAVIGSALVISQVLFALHSSFSGVVGYFVARTLGANKLEEAKQISRKLTKLVFLVSVIYSSFFLIFSYAIVKSFGASSSSIISKEIFETNLLYVIIMLSIINVSFCVETLYINLLWAGGKPGQVFIGDVLTNWFINGVVAFAVFFSDAHYVVIYGLLLISDLFKSFTLCFLVLRYEWVNNLTNKEKRSKVFLYIQRFIQKIFRRNIHEIR